MNFIANVMSVRAGKFSESQISEISGALEYSRQAAILRNSMTVKKIAASFYTLEAKLVESRGASQK